MPFTNNVNNNNMSNNLTGIEWLSLTTVAAADVNATLPERAFGNNNNVNTATYNESNDDLIHNQFVQFFFCIIYATVFVLGVSGNVLVCYVVLRNRAMQTVTNIFITNLALSDILLCVLAVPFTPLYTFMGRWAFGRTLCHLVSFAQGCSIYISTLTLTSIAVDRYFVIIHPFHPRMKLSTCISVIVCIWFVSLLATLPYGMYVKVVSDVLLLEQSATAETTALGKTFNSTAVTLTLNESAAASLNSTYYLQRSSEVTFGTPVPTTTSTAPTHAYCEENWPSEHYRKIFGSLTTILQFVLPFAIICICYTWVSLKLNARARAKPGSKSSRREEVDRDRKRRTNRMLISMVAVFGVSWLPLNLVNIFDDFYEKSNEWRFYTLFFFVAHSVAMSSTCYNPFLYAWLNENFRKEFKHVLPCFNPSKKKKNLIGLTHGYNRAERNTCGPCLHNGAGVGVAICGATDLDEYEDNGITQDSCLPKERLLIVPREATYGGNGGGGNGLPAAAAAVAAFRQASNELTSSIDNISAVAQGKGEEEEEEEADEDEEEQSIELRFVETPFVSSDNATGSSIILETSTSNELEQERVRGSN